MSLPVLRRVPCRLLAGHGAGRLGLQGPPGSSLRTSQLHAAWRKPSTVAFRPITQSLNRRTEYDDKARALNQKGLDEQEAEVRVRHNQIKRPWHREGADTPPAEDEQDDKPMTKGKLLTTPTRLLKLIIPLPVRVDHDKDNSSLDYGRSISSSDNIQPLALLVHPQQPLSYVERLIQAELPPIVEKGREKIPNIYFRAENPKDGDDGAGKGAKKKDNDGEDSGPLSPHVASYSGLGHEAEDTVKDADKNWVRWSSSTEMGDFIRDAARGREFAIEIEGMKSLALRVGVPSFADRTHYMRTRLRQRSREVERLASIKKECDLLAHRSAHRLAKGGFAALAVWWGIVYYITFLTPYGWDLVEPITYLAGLGTIMGGYLWFLYISRDLSYKAAMNVTVSRRQTALYESRGFDLPRWESLVQEANALRREIKIVAEEYDVEWDEARDLGGEEVKEVLDKEKRKEERRGGKEEGDEKGVAEEDDSEKKKAEKEKAGEKKIEEGESSGKKAES